MPQDNLRRTAQTIPEAPAAPLLSPAAAAERQTASKGEAAVSSFCSPQEMHNDSAPGTTAKSFSRSRNSRLNLLRLNNRNDFLPKDLRRTRNAFETSLVH